MFFQSILFVIMWSLAGIIIPIVILGHSIISDWWWGLFMLFFPLLHPLVWITIASILQLLGTFPLFPIWPGFGTFADSKLSNFKTMKKIFECNIPTLVFLFALNMIMYFGGIAGGGVALGMWVWFIYATAKKR